MELEELKQALNWQGVFQGTDCLVIVCNESDLYKLVGVRSNDTCFYLDYPIFQTLLVSFLITRDDETFQYWVLGDKLHRVNGPARISHNSTTNESHVIFYENGLKHHISGPAEVIIHNQQLTTVHPKSSIDVSPNHLIETWDDYECYWFTRGIESSYPTPHSMLCSNGYRIFRTTNDEPILDDCKNMPAFYASTVISNWAREGSAIKDDTFRIRSMSLSNYTRSFKSGVPISHECDMITQLSWINNGAVETTSSNNLEHVRDELFKSWNIFEGPFFSNDMEKLFAINEAL